MNHFGYGPESDETADYGGRADFAAKKQTSSLSSSTQTLVKGPRHKSSNPAHPKR